MLRLLAIARSLLTPEAVRFVLVGCSNFAVSFATFRLMLALPVAFAYKAGAAQLFAYGVGIVWSYFWNRRFTFRSSAAAGRQFIRFVSLQVAFALISAGGIEIFIHARLAGPTVAWFAVMAVITVANFVACRVWVFRSPGEVDGYTVH